MRVDRVRTPTLLQMEMVECGAACLGIILGFYGKIVRLTELRRNCGVSRDGSKASNVLAAARSYGMLAKGFKKELADLHQLKYPFIVFWNFKHFLVVEGYKRGRVYLNDPATGPRTVSFKEFDEGYTGVALAMQPGQEFTKGGRKQSVLGGIWQRLQSSLGAFVLCGVTALFLVLPGLAAPAFSRVFVDNVLIRHMEDWARPIIFGMALAALTKAFLTALQLRLLRRLKVKLSVSMSSRFVWHLFRLPADFYAQRYAGEVANRIALNDRAADSMSGKLASTAIDILMMFFYAIVMWQFDRWLTLVAVLFASIDFLVLRYIARRRVDATRRLMHEYGRMAGVGIAGLQSIRTIKASALESDFFAKVVGHHAKAVNTHQTLAVANLYLSLIPKFVSALMAGLILVLGGFRVMDGALTIGMLVAFQSLATSFLLPVNNLMGLGAMLQDLEGDITRLDDVLQHPAPDAQPVPVDESSPVRLSGRLELKNLRFGYNPTQPPLVDGFSLTLEPGQRVALVGGSGSGKSTISRLVAGLYDPLEGEILFDGMPRDRIPESLMSASLAMVDQEILLFAGSVRDNLTLWDATVSDEQLERACRDAAIHDAVVALPDGYDTHLIEGAANLSGGQRQRLEIARALCGEPTMLILDEATSALDAETERLIDQRIRLRGCSCLIVAHRLSTIRDADEIIVLDQGKIVQRGTHAKMVAEGGPYVKLVSIESSAMEADVPV
jgi:ATP-binding cassette subfamily C protein